VIEKYQLDNISLIKYLLSEATNLLTPTEKLVALAIARHRNNTSFKCCPSLSTLSKITGLCRKTISSTLNSIEAAGIIVRLRIKRGNGFAHNQYYFLYDIKDYMEIFNFAETILCSHHPEEYENFEFCIESNLFPVV